MNFGVSRFGLAAVEQATIRRQNPNGIATIIELNGRITFDALKQP